MGNVMFSIVYVCHPFSGDPLRNRRRIAAICRQLTEQGYTPMAPQLALPEYIDEELERDMAIAQCSRLMELVDEVWVYSSEPNHNFFGKTTIKAAIDQPNEVVVTLGSGAIVIGEVSQANSYLGFQMPSYNGAGPYMCTSDAQGRFKLTGVAPGIILRPFFHGKRIQVGSAGSEIKVKLK